MAAILQSCLSVFMIGFSVSGNFTNRFTLIHPDKIQASAASGVNGLLMLPTEELDGKTLDYPLETAYRQPKAATIESIDGY